MSQKRRRGAIYQPAELAELVVVAVAHSQSVDVEEGDVLGVGPHARHPQHRPHVLEAS